MGGCKSVACGAARSPIHMVTMAMLCHAKHGYSSPAVLVFGCKNVFIKYCLKLFSTPFYLLYVLSVKMV